MLRASQRRAAPTRRFHTFSQLAFKLKSHHLFWLCCRGNRHGAPIRSQLRSLHICQPHWQHSFPAPRLVAGSCSHVLLPCGLGPQGSGKGPPWPAESSLCSGRRGVRQLWLVALAGCRLVRPAAGKFTHQKLFAPPETLVMGILRRCRLGRLIWVCCAGWLPVGG